MIKTVDVFPEATLKHSRYASCPLEASLHQLIELVLCFWPRWLSHESNGFQLGLCVCIKSSSGKVAAKSNHLARSEPPGRCEVVVDEAIPKKNLAKEYFGGKKQPY